jgi:hypothetical protein
METGTQSQDSQAARSHHQEELHVVVHYAAAAHPFKEKAPRTEKVGQLKQQVLTAFHLHEGQLPNGDTVTYTLYHDKKALENPNETLGQVAGEHEELVLKLSQQITQG